MSLWHMFVRLAPARNLGHPPRSSRLSPRGNEARFTHFGSS